jgi:two-component system response regulator ArlR
MSRRDFRCIIADDEPGIGTLIQEILSRRGYAADVVGHGSQAERKLEDGEYALAVLDIMMPGRTGVEIASLHREGGKMTPIVLMSSYLSDEALVRCRDLGAIAFLSKPFGVEEFLEAVKAAGGPLSGPESAKPN